MGVDIEVRSIAHVMYDGHDVPVSVMHDEDPRRGPAPPGERRPPSPGPAPRTRPGGSRFESSRRCTWPMRCHTMERGSKSERPGRLRMSQESTPEREHLHQGGVSARKNRLDEVLRAVWRPLLEHAQNDVQMWTKGEA